MACPYFFPVNPRTEGLGPQHSMLPLGGLWTGVCRAVSESAFQPDDETTRTLCNLGYARGRCPRFPAGDGPDAARFTVSGDDGSSLRLFYVVERDHHPFAHGPLVYSPTRGEFDDPPRGETISRQARAYAESYLRLKMEASSR